jgi:phosphoserine phosphatase RsbU/P
MVSHAIDIDAVTAWHTTVVDLLERAKLAQPDQLPEVINTALRAVDLEARLYLVDHEQRRLWPVPDRDGSVGRPLSVDGTVAGRAFTVVRTQWADDGTAGVRLWVPLIDGAERLGVAELTGKTAPRDPAALRRACEWIVGLVGHLITAKLPYGDALQLVRRTRPMTTAAELLLQTLPPLTFSCDRASVTAILEPCYDVGGDGFDYAVDGDAAWVSVLDAMGRGLKASLACVTAMAALRAARRDGRDLSEQARAADAAIREQFTDLRFVTAVLVEFNMDTGRLRYVGAGHPPPLVLRRGKAVRQLLGGRRLPLGLGDDPVKVAEETLEPGDRLLLYTDGVVEADDGHGVLFGVDRLVDLAERGATASLPGPETLRRLAHSVLEHQGGPPRDDATLVLFEWSREAARRTQP